MNEEFDKLCDKFSLTDEVKFDLKKFVENEIFRALEIKTLMDNKTPQGAPEGKKSSGPLDKIKKDGICIGIKGNGDACTFKSKPDSDYCGRHNKETSKASSSGRIRVKKDAPKECYAVITKTGDKCSNPGTVKPEGADFYYCKRHSVKWTEYEKDREPDLAILEE